MYRALNLNTGQMVAVKRIGLEGLKEEEISQLMREVDLVKRLSHPSIVKYEGMARDENTLSIVLECVILFLLYIWVLLSCSPACLPSCPRAAAHSTRHILTVLGWLRITCALAGMPRMALSGRLSRHSAN